MNDSDQDVHAHAYKDGELGVKITNTAFIDAFEAHDKFEVEHI